MYNIQRVYTTKTKSEIMSYVRTNIDIGFIKDILLAKRKDACLKPAVLVKNWILIALLHPAKYGSKLSFKKFH